MSQLHERSLDLYFDQPGWNEPIPEEPVLSPSPDDSVWSRNGEIERMKERVRSGLACTNGLLLSALFSLKRPVGIAVALQRVTREKYDVLCEIIDIFRADPAIKAIADFKDVASWSHAIAETRRILHFSGYERHSDDRTVAVGEACKRLETQGFIVTLNALGVDISTTDLGPICADIERRIKHIGGRQVIDATLKWFEVNKRIF
ncbi:hypothetical protein NWI01_05350 [Nitrobacter winogradskyi]|nr:hypothetical protein NWI01_05350 [Nitrobacter winogradskyi]